MAQDKRNRRPIITEDELIIDPETLDTSDGRRIANWVRLRSQYPVKRGQLFDLERAATNPPNLSFLRFLQDDNHNNEEQAQADESLEDPEPEEHDTATTSLLSKTIDKFKGLTKGLITQNANSSRRNSKSEFSKPKDIRQSHAKSARNTLVRQAVLKSVDLQPEQYNEVVSTPIVGHRVELNASASPIRMPGSKPISVRKPEAIIEKLPNPSRCTSKPSTSKNQVVVLKEVVFSPRIQKIVDDSEEVSPIGIIHGTEKIRPKNLSQMIAKEVNKSRHENQFEMIPERNENFEPNSSEGSELEFPPSKVAERDSSQHTQSDQEVVIPETQENRSQSFQLPMVQTGIQQRRLSSSSSSSASSSVLYGFNESLLPTNEMTSRSPYGPPILRTILSTMNRQSSIQAPSESVAGLKTTKKRRPPISTTTNKYLDLNKSERETTERRNSKSRVTMNNKSKRKLYSERFDERSPRSSNVSVVDEGEVIIPETQEEVEIPVLIENVNISRNRNNSKGRTETFRKSRNDSDVTKMPPPPAPPKKNKLGRPRKKDRSQRYVTPETSSSRNESESQVVNVYVDSDQGSDAKSTRSTKSAASKKSERYAMKPVLVDSVVFEKGVRRSKRTRYLTPWQPGQSSVPVTTEELHAIYKEQAIDHFPKKFYYTDTRRKNKKNVIPNSVTSTKPKTTKKSTNKKQKENMPSEEEPMPSISEEPGSEPQIPSKNKRSVQKAQPKKNYPISDVAEPEPVSNTSRANSQVGQFKVPNNTKQKRARNEAQQENDNISQDSGLHTVSETSNAAHISPVQQKQAAVRLEELTPTRKFAQNSSQASERYSGRFEWISELLNPHTSERPFYVSDFDELASSEEISFVDLGGVQYAVYMGAAFKNCGYMRIKEEFAKKRGKAVKYDLRFLVIKASNLEVTIADKSMKPKEGSMFYVQKGISYSIINHSKSKALLYFTRFP